ncbi:60S ribosomal protein L21 [Plecturocebus cupreus]
MATLVDSVNFMKCRVPFPTPGSITEASRWQPWPEGRQGAKAVANARSLWKEEDPSLYPSPITGRNEDLVHLRKNLKLSGIMVALFLGKGMALSPFLLTLPADNLQQKAGDLLVFGNGHASTGPASGVPKSSNLRSLQPDPAVPVTHQSCSSLEPLLPSHTLLDKLTNPLRNFRPDRARLGNKSETASRKKKKKEKKKRVVVPLATYMQIFKKDHIVDTKEMGRPPKCYHGNTRRAYSATQHVVGIVVNKQVKAKILAKRTNLLEICEENDQKNKEAKEKVTRIQLKCQPAPPEKHTVILLCHLGWSRVVRSQLTAALTSQVQAVLLFSLPSYWDYRCEPSCQTNIFFVEMGSLHVAQAGLDLLSSSGLPALTSETLWEVEVGRSQRQEFETSLANMVSEFIFDSSIQVLALAVIHLPDFYLENHLFPYVQPGGIVRSRQVDKQTNGRGEEQQRRREEKERQEEFR